MLPYFLSIPILAALAMLQSAILSRIPLLHGTADLVMLAIIAWSLHDRVQSAWIWAVVGGLIMSLVSGIPFGIYLGGYLLITLAAMLLKRTVWKIPILAMLLMVFIGTLLTQGLSFIALILTGTPLPLLDTVNLIILPSLLLNLLLSIPAYILVGDYANWIHPLEIEV
jgi:rod shape-determining protein MreD